MRIPFIGKQDKARSINVDNQQLQNWYLEVDQDGYGNIVAYPTPGLTLYATTGIGPIRGSINYNNLLYVVSGNTLYEVTTDKVVTSRGTLNTDSGQVSLAHNGANNGQQLIIVDGTNGYIFDSGAVSFAVIADADFPDTATHVVFKDGYFIVNDPTNSGRFYISSSYDGTAWATLDFATAERNPDELQAIMAVENEVWFIGVETAEVWWNSGQAAFPYEPVQSGFSNMGTVAKYSPAEALGSVFWLSQNKEGRGQVVRTEGLRTIPVSSKSIEESIDQMSTVSDAIGYTYQGKGHTFYVLIFPTENKTFVYDMTSNLWHTWSSSGGRHRSNTHTFFNGKHVVGDYENGRLYLLDYNTYTDNGSAIIRKMVAPHIHADDAYLRFHSLEVAVEGGVGDNTTTNPVIMLRISKDGGHTWSSEMWRQLGAIGEYEKRCIWRNLGSGHKLTAELTVSDPVKAVLIAGFVNVSKGPRMFR